MTRADNVSTGSVEEDQDLVNQGQTNNKLMNGCGENESDDEKQESPYIYIETLNEDFFIGATTIDNKGEGTTASRGSFQPPKLTDWKKYKTHPDNISIIIAKAQQQLWLKGKREIAIIKNNILGISINNPYSGDLAKVYHFLFGTKSILCKIFCYYINSLTKKVYLEFLIFFHVQESNITSHVTFL